MQNTNYLHSLRQFELEIALQSFPKLENSTGSCSVLDIGAGTGHQARLLARRGYLVTAVDIASSSYHDQRVYPVIEYDGNILPVPAESIAVVFSSNVLEHIVGIDDFLDEISRVMVPGAYAIHILPTPAWRFWTILGHYGWLAKQLFFFFYRGLPAGSLEVVELRNHKRWRAFIGTLIPLRHGVRGVTLTEMYYYSRNWWTQRFEARNFRVVDSYPTGLFYSGACVLGEHLSIHCRRRLSRLLGSACRIYVLRHLYDE
jgi:SAM-dependent methyltransferase